MVQGIENQSNSYSSYLFPSAIFNLSERLVNPITQDQLVAIQFLDEVKLQQQPNISAAELTLRAIKIFNSYNPEVAEIIPIGSVRDKKPKTIRRHPRK